ncbi:MAG: recombinase family protein [Chloroflexota bacterium]|nr:recombinase family protein [Chloroflexota bacterium]
MPVPRAFKPRQAETHFFSPIGPLPEIDKKRITAVLVRQSTTGADTANAESRETQLGLQDYSKLLYGEEEPLVELYDEGAGVSGQKRIDQRAILDRLYQKMSKGIVGQLVMTREDRLFRNKHMDQVGVFTKLAEEKKIKVIVPPISSASVDEKTRVYDFTLYRDLIAFQDKMREAYGYIEGHVRHMHNCQQAKADKGGWDGRGLPPGFAVKGKKQEQKIIIYEPWAEEMRKLALRAQALDWDMGKLGREVAQKAFLFPEIPEEDRERYLFKLGMDLIPGVGYKPRKIKTIRDWFTNEMYIGWWQPDEDQPDVLIDHHDPILDYALFAEGYARLTGYTLEGAPVDNHGGVTRTRKDRKAPPDALFHGRLIATPPMPDRRAFTSIDEVNGILLYLGNSPYPQGMGHEKIFCIPAAPFDTIPVNRLKALIARDEDIADKVKETLEQVYNQQGEDFVSIHEQLKGIEIQLQANARKIANENDEELEKELRVKRAELMAIKQDLTAKKERLGIIDSPEEITQLHRLLGNFDAVWPGFDLAQRQRAFSLLINRIEIEVVSPHWLRLSIDWLDAIHTRVDVAYVWKKTPSKGEKFSDEEKEIIRQLYPTSARLDILQLLPDRTWDAIQTQATLAQVKRRVPKSHDIPPNACYLDLVPGLDSNYLLGNYQTTVEQIVKANANTTRKGSPLYPLWILPAGVNNMGPFSQEDLMLAGYGGGLPTKEWLLSLERATLHASSDQPQDVGLSGEQGEPMQRSQRYQVGQRPVVP